MSVETRFEGKKWNNLCTLILPAWPCLYMYMPLIVVVDMSIFKLVQENACTPVCCKEVAAVGGET